MRLPDPPDEDLAEPIPVLPQYDSAKYWDERYANDADEFEWYQNYDGLSLILKRAVPSDASVLQLGVGVSALAASWVEQGGHRGKLVNLDVSRVCVRHMRELHAHLRPQVSYVAGDACDLKQRAGTAAAAAAAAAYADKKAADTKEKDEQEEQDRLNYAVGDQSFDAVLDKGTLDAIVCGCGADQRARALVAEAARVLKRGGAFVLVTYGAPDRRLGHLLPDEYTQSSSEGEEEEEEKEEEEEGKKEEKEAAAAPTPRPASPPPPRPYGGRQLPWGPRDVDIYLIVKPDAREDAEAAVGAPPLAADEEEDHQQGEEDADDEEAEDARGDVVIFGPLCCKDDLLMERVSALQGAHFAYVCRRPLDR